MADIQAIANDLSNLTVLQVAELVKTLEEKWESRGGRGPGHGGAAGAPAAGGAAVAEEQTEFAVHLTSAATRRST